MLNKLDLTPSWLRCSPISKAINTSHIENTVPRQGQAPDTPMSSRMWGGNYFMSHLTNRADKHCAQIYFCGRLGASLALRALLIPAGLCFVFEVSSECALLGAS